jgi:hypothetical protein
MNDSKKSRKLLDKYYTDNSQYVHIDKIKSELLIYVSELLYSYGVETEELEINSPLYSEMDDKFLDILKKYLNGK